MTRREGEKRERDAANGRDLATEGITDSARFNGAGLTFPSWPLLSYVTCDLPAFPTSPWLFLGSSLRLNEPNETNALDKWKGDRVASKLRNYVNDNYLPGD